MLNQHKIAYTARSSPRAFAQALQEARVIVQGAQLSDDQTLLQANADRDSFMAENIAWLHEWGQGGAKMVLWAHDGHIATAGQWYTMGEYLRDWYQSQYLAIGTSFYEGFFNAIGTDSHGHTTTLQSFHVQAKPGSYNYELGTVGLPLYALDLRNIPPGPLSDWMNSHPPFFEVGSAYDPAQVDSFYLPTNLPQFFDVIISIQRVTASQLLPWKN